jgi:hypothetical protein
LAEVDEVSIFWLSDLIDSKGESREDLPNADRDVETRGEVCANAFRQLGGLRREDVDLLRHALHVAIGIHGLCAE